MSGGAVYKPFFSKAQLAQWREVIARGLQSQVTIQRLVTADSPYGDDEISSWQTIDTVPGWIRSTPTPVRQEDSGAIITVNTYRLLVDSSTDIRPADLVIVAGATFVVSDTTVESTWLPYLQCSLRRRE